MNVSGENMWQQCSGENKIGNNWKLCITRGKSRADTQQPWRQMHKMYSSWGEDTGWGEKRLFLVVDGDTDFSSGKLHIRKYQSRLSGQHRWRESAGLRGESHDSLCLGTPAMGIWGHFSLDCSLWAFQMWGQLKTEVTWSWGNYDLIGDVEEIQEGQVEFQSLLQPPFGQCLDSLPCWSLGTSRISKVLLWWLKGAGASQSWPIQSHYPIYDLGNGPTMSKNDMIEGLGTGHRLV